MITRVVQTLRSLFRGSVKAKHLGGIITIFRGSKSHTKIGLMRGLLFLAMVSINLAILNILPIPVLDGGWLVFLIIEKQKADAALQAGARFYPWPVPRGVACSEDEGLYRFVTSFATREEDVDALADLLK